MWPALRTGDLAELAAVSPSVEIGAVVVARTGGALVAHRVRAWTASGELVLRGDTCTEDDPPVPLSRVLGVIRRVRRGQRTLTANEWDATWCHVLSVGVRVRRRLARWSHSR